MRSSGWMSCHGERIIRFVIQLEPMNVRGDFVQEAEMVSDARHGTRVACSDRCLLIHNGASHPCKLENISLSGALVQCDCAVSGSLSLGDRCGVLLCCDPKICSGEYPALVVRLNESRVGLQFLDV